jgi:carboxymethylenebutenolidase
LGNWIELADGTRAYRSVRGGDDRPGVVLVHAWWGLNQTIRNMADRLAEEGFTVLAPDLFEGVVVTTEAEAEAAAGAEPREARLSRVLAALRALRDEPRMAPDRVGVMGISLGAMYALEAAAGDSQIAAVVLFYGTGAAHDWSSSRAAFQGHFAEHDPFEATTDVAVQVEALRAGGRPVELHVYPGTGHWFMEPDRTETYNADAADLAWERTATFLRERLRRES